MITSLHFVKVRQLKMTQNTFETFETTNASFKLRFLPLYPTHFFPFSVISGFSLRAQTGHFRSLELKKQDSCGRSAKFIYLRPAALLHG